MPSSSSSSSIATTVPQALCDILAGNSAVTAIVGSRIYPNELQQGVTFAAVCYTRITRTQTITDKGKSGVSCTRGQLNCYSPTYVQAIQLGEAVEAALLFYQGGNVQGIFPIDNSDLPKLTVNEEHNLFCSKVEVYIWFNE